MRNPMQRPAAVLLTLALCGCAAAKPVPVYLTQANTDHPKFPRGRYLTAVGISQSSAEDAEARAKKNVAESVQSELKAETANFMQSASSNGSSSESQLSSETIRITTRFDQANLIVIVERADSSGVFYALAALDRAAADAEIGRTKQTDLVNFIAFAESALAARQQARAGDFVTAANRAERLLSSVDATFIVRRAVLGHPSLEEEKFIERRNALLRERAKAASQRVVSVRIEGLESAQLLKLAVGAVRKLGLRVSENKTCAQQEENAEDATELVLQPEENCQEGSLGERCEIAVRLHAKGCMGGGEGEGRIAQVRGVHPSDRARAKTAAWARITDLLVEGAVKEALRGAQVVDCSGSDC